LISAKVIASVAQLPHYMVKDMKTKIMGLLFSLFLLGCSGYRYSLIEDERRYLLEGHFHNNNPFTEVKAITPHNYIVEKTNQGLAKKQDIYQFTSYDIPSKDDRILGGYIEDKSNTVEIRLMIKDSESGFVKDAIENGIYKLQGRSSVENLCAYIDQKYSWLGNNKTLKRDLNACGLSAP
jgi:hypothetical protein